MKNQYLVTKYDPSLRDATGAYTGYDWISRSDIGRMFDGGMLSETVYLNVENSYLSAMKSFLDEAGIESLELTALERRDAPADDFLHRRNLSIAQSLDFARLVLREEAWGKLGVPGKAYVHFPLAHAHAVAQGLHAGYQRDFVTALHILLPQFENIVRALLKAASVLTTRTDDSGITMEVGLSALVKEPKLVEILGGDVVFGIRTLMCTQVGPNFRNDIAHGLATSADCNTLVGLYTWWFIFRLVFIQWHLASQPTDRPEVSASDSF